MDLAAPRQVGVTLRARSGAVPWWVEGLAIGVASRLFSLGLIWVAAARAQQLAPELWTDPGGALGVWDGQWFLRIAASGYHADPIEDYHDFAFFPLWPLVIRAGSLGGLVPLEVVGPILANLFFVAGLVLAYRAFMQFGTRSSARFGVALLAFGPAAYTFSLMYAESLFLLLAAASFAAVGTRRAWLVALAGLTRLTGLGLALGGLVQATRAGDRRHGLVVFVAGAGAFAIWWIFIWALTADPLGYLRGTPSWIEGAIGPASALEAPLGYGFFALLYIGLMGLGTARLFRDGHRGAAAYSLFAVATAFLLGAWTEMPRYAMAAFPANVALAALLPTPRSRWLMVGFFAALQFAWVMAIYSGFGGP